MKRYSLIFMIFSLFTPMLSAKEFVLPKDKKQLKKYYEEIHLESKKLKRVPDDKLLGDILVACAKAKIYDPNIFCLESLTEFYRYFPHSVERVSRERLSEEDALFVIKRLDILKAETLEGNDPSSKP